MTEHPEEMPARDPLAAAVETTFREARGAGLSIAAAADIVAAAIHDHIDKQSLSDVAAADVVHVQSILSHRSGEALVQVRSSSLRWQWKPEEARGHALKLLEVAEAAVHDAAVYRWFTLSAGVEPGAAATALVELRRFRGDIPREDWQPPA